MDGAVVVDVHSGAGLSADLLDHAAALADDLADLVHVDLHGDHLGGVLAHLGTGLSDAGQHDLVQDGIAGVLGDLQGLLDDLVGQTVVLQVHLDGGDTGLGAGHLEVHLAVEVLHALDVDEGLEGAVVVLDEAAGDAGHGGLDGHAGVHQSQGGAADGALGGGAVGGQDLAHHADGVGELVHAGQHGHQSALSQSAVTVLAAVGGAGSLGLAHGVGGEVVVVHVPLLFLFPDGVQLLRGGQGVQGGHGQDLGLAAGEQAGAVDLGQHAHLGAQGTDLVLGAAVHAVALEQPGLDDLLLELVGELLEILVHLGVLLQVVLVPLVDHGVPALLADVLVVGVHGGLGLVHVLVHDLVEQLLVEVSVVVLHLGLADLGHDVVDEGDLLLDLLVGLHDALVHDVVGDLVGAGLDHDHLLLSGGHGHVHAGGLALLLSGVEDDLAVAVTHLQAADGAGEGDLGVAQAGGHADHGGDLGGAVIVHAHDGAGDAHVVAEVVGEQGADGPVDEAGGQHGGQGGTALTAHEGAGDAAHGVQLLLKVHAQGEEVHAVPGTGGDADGHVDGGVAVAHQSGGVGQLGGLAHLDGEGTAGDLSLEDLVVGELLVGDDGRHGCPPFRWYGPASGPSHLLAFEPGSAILQAHVQLLKKRSGPAGPVDRFVPSSRRRMAR
ncbi:Uncharacterised protein [uncultured Flavonifractor sp.]|nr:Uncharacterised protein [uncultured Flavonifractor sp.]